MIIFDVQIRTDCGEVMVLQVSASSPQEAEMTAISIVNSGEAGTLGREVVDCFAFKAINEKGFNNNNGTK